MRRPINIRGSIAAVPLNMAPAAKVADPMTHRPENRNAPTENLTGTHIRNTVSIVFMHKMCSLLP